MTPYRCAIDHFLKNESRRSIEFLFFTKVGFYCRCKNRWNLEAGRMEKNYSWTISKRVVSHLLIHSTLLKIYDAAPLKHKGQDTSSLSTRAISFSCVAFGPELPAYQLPEATHTLLSGNEKKSQHSYAFPMVAADQRGHIYSLDFHRNRLI